MQKNFYKMRQRKPEYYSDYFEFMEINKDKPLLYKDVVNHFYDRFERIEASFSSELV